MTKTQRQPGFYAIHEMAHLVLGKTGISGVYIEKTIEKFCNDVASEFLLPSVEVTNSNHVKEILMILRLKYLGMLSQRNLAVLI